jgi:hypothetical protein
MVIKVRKIKSSSHGHLGKEIIKGSSYDHLRKKIYRDNKE